VDADGDGDLTAVDPVFAQLRVWQDANANGIADNGETHSLAQIGVTALHYRRGSYERNGTTYQLASPDLNAEALGTIAHTVEGGILVNSNNGQTSLIVTAIADLSNIAPGMDRIDVGIEDTPLNILASSLLANDRIGNGATLTLSAVGDARHGTVTLQNEVLHFTPQANYFGADAGFSYTVHDALGNSAQANVVVTLAAVNDTPTPSNRNDLIIGDLNEDGSQRVNPWAGVILVDDPDDTMFTYALTHDGLHGHVASDSALAEKTVPDVKVTVVLTAHA